MRFHSLPPLNMAAAGCFADAAGYVGNTLSNARVFSTAACTARHTDKPTPTVSGPATSLTVTGAVSGKLCSIHNHADANHPHISVIRFHFPNNCFHPSRVSPSPGVRVFVLDRFINTPSFSRNSRKIFLPARSAGRCCMHACIFTLAAAACIYTHC